MKEVNAQIVDVDIQFYREYRRVAIEFILRSALGECHITIPANQATIMELFVVLDVSCLDMLRNSYVRMIVDDDEKVKGLKHIMNDGNGVFEYKGNYI